MKMSSIFVFIFPQINSSSLKVQLFCLSWHGFSYNFIYVICQVNGCLSYYDRVPDGFYLIQGMDPFVWTLCTDVQEESRIPSLESLRNVHPSESSIEVALIDRNNDSDLRQLQNLVAGLSCNCTTTNDMVKQLAKLVCSRMG